MKGRFAGVLLVLGAILIAAGVFPTWVTVGAANQSPVGSVSVTTGYNGFSSASSNVDVVVSFAIAGVLVLIAFTLSLWATVINRALAFVAGVAALLWAGVLALVLSSWGRDAITTLAPNVTRSVNTVPTTFGLGFYLTAGGGVLALIGGFVALVVRRRRVVVRAPAAATPTPATATPATAGSRPGPGVQPAPAPQDGAPRPAPASAPSRTPAPASSSSSTFPPQPGSR